MEKQNIQFDRSDESVKEKMSEEKLQTMMQAQDEELNYLILRCSKMVEHRSKTIVNESTEDHAFRLGEIDAYSHVLWICRQNLSENIMKEALSPCGCEGSQ
jgi:hypothetical protein